MSGDRTPGDGLVAVLSPTGENPESYFSAVQHGGGTPVAVGAEQDLPARAGALLAIGHSPFDGSVPVSLHAALDSDLPVLGVDWGMHAVNVALGGSGPIKMPEFTISAPRLPMFISPGAKFSYTIAGSGWVSVPFRNSRGIRPSGLATGLLGSCYLENGFLAAFEKPGRHWIIGVQWAADEIESLPSGFDSLLLALVERSAGIQQ